MVKKTDWVVVGFPKCGTTALIKYLASLPKINVASANNQESGLELHYYDSEKSPDYLEQRYKLGFFNGHKTVNYIYSEKVLYKILSDNKDVRVIVCTRPIKEVLVSWYNMHKRIASKGKIGSHFTCKNEETRQYYLQISLNDYFNKFENQLNYGKHLKNLFNVFSSEQIYICSINLLATEPDNTLSEIYQFISSEKLQNYDTHSFSKVNIKNYDNILEKELSEENTKKLNNFQLQVNKLLKKHN